MAIIGLVIGLAFACSMVIGPILNAHIGVSGIFWLTCVLAGLGLLILHTLVPTPPRFIHHHDTLTIPQSITQRPTPTRTTTPRYRYTHSTCNTHCKLYRTSSVFNPTIRCR